MDIDTLTRKLKSARYEAKKQSEIANDISREIVKHMRKYLTASQTSLPWVSKRSGIPLARLVNWLSGQADHCLPYDKVTVIWNAITPTKDQKPSFSYQLRHLPAADWEQTNEALAKQIGCSKEHVRLFRKNKTRNTPQK